MALHFPLVRRIPAAQIIIYLMYAGVAVVITWPLVTVFTERLAGHSFSDSTEYARHIWWIRHALQTGQPLFFQPLLAYPDGLPGMWLWGNPLQSFPAWLFAFAMPLPAAYNLALLLNLALNGWSMHQLAYKLTASRSAAWLSGTVFMCYPTFQGQLAAGHSGLLVLWGVPFYAGALLDLREKQHWRIVVRAALWLVVSILGNNLLLVYLLLPVTAVFAFVLVVRREWAALRGVIFAGILGGAAALIFAAPVALEALSSPAFVREGGDVFYSADVLSVVTPSFQHPVLGALPHTGIVLGIDPFEKPAYIGILAGALVFIGVWRRREARWWLLLALVAWALSLGPLLRVLDQPVRAATDGYESYITLPWAAFRNLPLLNIARTPARFNFALAVAVAVMAGYGAASLRMPKCLSVNRAKRRFAPTGNKGFTLPLWSAGRWLAIGLAAGIMVWEYQLFWTGLPTNPGIVPQPIAALSSRDDVRAVFDIPWSHLLTDKDALYLQTGHQQPLVAGHVTRRTPVDPARLWILEGTLDLAHLNASGVDIIILHKDWAADAAAKQAHIRSVMGEAFYQDGRIAAWETPETQEEPGFASVITPLTEITDRADSYFYLAQSGWVRVQGRLSADGRESGVYLDDRAVFRVEINGSLLLDLPVYAAAGYHTLSLRAEPPCPTFGNPALRCRAVGLEGLSVSDTENRLPALSGAFVEGVSLEGAAVSQAGNDLVVWLAWGFSQPRDTYDIRFVHVLAPDGGLVVQDDRTLGAQVAGGGWMDVIRLLLPDDLPSGDYRVVTGWYRYTPAEEITRFGLVSGGDGGVELGVVTVE